MIGWVIQIVGMNMASEVVVNWYEKEGKNNPREESLGTGSGGKGEEIRENSRQKVGQKYDLGGWNVKSAA